MCTFIGSVRLIEIFSNVLKKSQRETITQVDANYVESHKSQEKHVALSRPERRQALKGRHCKSGKFRKTKKYTDMKLSENKEIKQHFADYPI